jgi:hypothetical protein
MKVRFDVKKVTEKEKAQIKDLFAKGHTIPEISAKVKRSHTTVRFHVYDRPKPKKAKEGFFDVDKRSNWLINEY